MSNKNSSTKKSKGLKEYTRDEYRAMGKPPRTIMDSEELDEDYQDEIPIKSFGEAFPDECQECGEPVVAEEGGTYTCKNCGFSYDPDLNRENENSMGTEDDEDWIDPAGGRHSHDEEDPAKMYENLTTNDFGDFTDNETTEEHICPDCGNEMEVNMNGDGYECPMCDESDYNESSMYESINEGLNSLFSDKKKKPLKEDKDKSILLDDNEESEDDEMPINIEDETDEATEEDGDNESEETIEVDADEPMEDQLTDDEEDLDSALSSELAEPEEEFTAETMDNYGNNISMQDLEMIFKKYLNIDLNRELGEKNIAPVAAGAQSMAPQIIDGLEGSTETLSGDENELSATYGHPGVETLDSDFQDVQNKIQIVKGKIENETSYNDILTGENSDEEAIPNPYERTDGYDAEDFSLEDDDFVRNSELSNGVEELEDGDTILPSDSDPGIIDGAKEDMTDDILFDDDEEMAEDVLPSVSGNEYKYDTAPPALPTTNKTVNCGGTQIQIVLTGVILTMPEVQTIAEGAKKHGLKVKKIHSNKKEELNIIVEKAGKDVTINYKDISKLKNKYPFTTREGKFQSLNEAYYSIQFDVYKANAEKENFKKILTEENLSKSIDLRDESTLLSEFKGKVKDIASWNVKAMGSINLKTGINETYSNISQHTKEPNVLVKTTNGQYFLMKGNLKERSKVGTKKDLIDLEGKKAYGKAIVVGIYENTAVGLGKIMYKVKQTSLPLLIWK